MADLCAWSWAEGDVGQHRDRIAQAAALVDGGRLHERVFAWMTLADDRNLRETLIAGASVYRAPALAPSLLGKS